MQVQYRVGALCIDEMADLVDDAGVAMGICKVTEV